MEERVIGVSTSQRRYSYNLLDFVYLFFTIGGLYGLGNRCFFNNVGLTTLPLVRLIGFFGKRRDRRSSAFRGVYINCISPVLVRLGQEDFVKIGPGHAQLDFTRLLAL